MEARFETEQRGRQPSLLLLAVAPAIDSRRTVLDACINRFEDVRRLQADTELAEQTKAVKGERLLDALIQTRRGRRVEQREFGADLPQGPLGRLVRRLLVGRLEFPPKRGAVPLRQIREHVL